MARWSRDDRRGQTPGERAASGAVVDRPTLTWRDAVPEQVQLPELADMLALDDAQLSDLLRQFGITESWPQMRAAAAGYVTRLTNKEPGSPAFEKALDDLLDVESRRGLLQMSRATLREYTTLDVIDGDLTTELIRISEGDDHVCESCQELAGEIGTIAEHESMGLPGAASCDGGDLCRCQLVAIR